MAFFFFLSLEFTQESSLSLLDPFLYPSAIRKKNNIFILTRWKKKFRIIACIVIFLILNLHYLGWMWWGAENWLANRPVSLSSNIEIINFSYILHLHLENGCHRKKILFAFQLVQIVHFALSFWTVHIFLDGYFFPKSSLFWTGQLHGSSLLEELQGQHATLRDCIEQLTTVESVRANLVSQLREAVQEQVGYPDYSVFKMYFL